MIVFLSRVSVIYESLSNGWFSTILFRHSPRACYNNRNYLKSTLQERLVNNDCLASQFSYRETGFFAYHQVTNFVNYCCCRCSCVYITKCFTYKTITQDLHWYSLYTRG